jgi:hypothetical protein
LDSKDYKVSPMFGYMKNIPQLTISLVSLVQNKKIVINMYWEINSSFKEIKKRKVMGKELFP